MGLYEDLVASVKTEIERWELDRDTKIAAVQTELEHVTSERDLITQMLSDSEGKLRASDARLELSTAEVARLTATIDQLQARIRELEQTAPGARDRTKMIVGVDKPGKDTTGPRPGVALVDVEAPAGQTHVTITGPGQISGKRFWCEVRVADGVELDENDFVIAGPDPRLATSESAAVRHFGGSGGYKKKKIKLRNGLIDPALWIEERGRSQLSPHVTGVKGHNFDLEHVEILNAGDGIHIMGTKESVFIAEQMSVSVRFCLVHKGAYSNPFSATSDGQPHSDGVQISAGRNILIEGNVIGGERDVAGYLMTPSEKNTGDDFWNTSIMIMQEIAGEAAKITNAVIRKNWLGGGAATVIIAYSSVEGRTNDFAGLTVEENRMLDRGPTWGFKLTSSDRGVTFRRADTSRVGGLYFSIYPQVRAAIRNNVNDRTSELISA